jgi:hypothetical protein
MTSGFDPKDILESADGVTSPVGFTRSNRPGRLLVSMEMSEGALNMLDELASATGQKMEDVIGKAFLLYKAAVDAQKAGKSVGVAPTSDVLETEFVGL